MPNTKILPFETRAAIKPGSWNPEKRTIDVVFSTGAKGLRETFYGDLYYEELEISDQALRLERLNAGAAVLDAHSSFRMRNQIGCVERAWLEGEDACATLRFSEREEIADLVKDIADGIIRNLSVGYFVHVYEVIETGDGTYPTYRAVDWEPYEISFVPVGFDAGAQTRSAAPTGPREVEIRSATPTPAAERGALEDTMPNPNKPENNPNPAPETKPGTEQRDAGGNPTPAPAPAPAPTPAEQTRAAAEAERARARAIRNQVRIAKLGDDLADTLIDEGVSLEVAQERIFEKWSERDAGRGTSGANPKISRDEVDTFRRGMAGAILLRTDPRIKLPEADLEMARQFRHMSLLRLAEETLTRAGESVKHMSGMQLAARALHSTSDFPLILSDVANQRLQGVYAAAPSTYQVWARRAPNAPDFKDINVLQIGGAPDLELVGEGGEFKRGTVGEGREKYRVLTYGKIIGFTRQSIVNDDLRAFDRVLTGFAGAARRLENRLVYRELTSNPDMADGTALFHADHGNLGGAGAISVATLGAGRAAMRKQKGLQKEALNITPAYLIVPTDLEQVAYQYTSSQFVPAKATDTNEFRTGGRTALEPVVEAELDATSTSQWYLAGNGMDCDTVEYCWLDGAEGVHLESEVSFDIDGMQMKARLDFAAKATDHRGLYRNG